MQPGEVLEAASLKDDCRFPCLAQLYSPEARGERGIPVSGCSTSGAFMGEPRGRSNSLGQ